MAILSQIDFRNNIFGPGAENDYGWRSVDHTQAGNSSIQVGVPYGRTTNNTGARIVTDSRSRNSNYNNRTVLQGYDDRTYTQLNTTSHPMRPKHNETWWYSFSFRIAGTAWAKSATFDSYIWSFQPIETNQNATTVGIGSALPLLGFIIDDPSATVNTYTATPKLYLHTLNTGFEGTALTQYLNASNFQRNQVGANLIPNTFYDVKVKTVWRETATGTVSVWLKSQYTENFTSSAQIVIGGIQNVAITKVAG